MKVINIMNTLLLICVTFRFHGVRDSDCRESTLRGVEVETKIIWEAQDFVLDLYYSIGSLAVEGDCGRWIISTPNNIQYPVIMSVKSLYTLEMNIILLQEFRQHLAKIKPRKLQSSPSKHRSTRPQYKHQLSLLHSQVPAPCHQRHLYPPSLWAR